MSIPREAWPWIIVFVVVMLAFALMAWWGYERWEDTSSLASGPLV
jgi:DNA-binding transcriptional regulator of glucitol operon